MKRTTLPLLVVFAASLPVYAMGSGEIALDTNADGMLSLIEVQAVYPEVTEDIFFGMDQNDDGLLDADEVSAAQEAGVMPVPNEG